MTWWEALAILAAGMGAGMINAVVGSGSLITFPTLVALGYPPLLSNVSNNIGLVPGSVTAVYGYRRELVGQRVRLTRLVPASLLGASIGSTLLLVLPSDVFDGVVVVLVRRWGGLPEGVMYAILLMNGATPLLERFFQPRPFGRGGPV